MKRRQPPAVSAAEPSFAQRDANHEAPAAGGCSLTPSSQKKARNRKRRQPKAVSAAVVCTKRRETGSADKKAPQKLFKEARSAGNFLIYQQSAVQKPVFLPAK
jgi:hypothetical protein